MLEERKKVADAIEIDRFQGGSRGDGPGGGGEFDLCAGADCGPVVLRPDLHDRAQVAVIDLDADGVIAERLTGLVNDPDSRADAFAEIEFGTKVAKIDRDRGERPLEEVIECSGRTEIIHRRPTEHRLLVVPAPDERTRAVKKPAPPVSDLGADGKAVEQIRVVAKLIPGTIRRSTGAGAASWERTFHEFLGPR